MRLLQTWKTIIILHKPDLCQNYLNREKLKNCHMSCQQISELTKKSQINCENSQKKCITASQKAQK